MTAALHLAMKAVQQQSDIAAVNGAVSWRLPLDLPTGRNGASPSFNIEYSSHRGNDICGVGMGLRGVSAMRRRERQPGPWATRPLLLEGVGALVEVSKGVWRPEHSALSCRAEPTAAGGWTVTYPDGRQDHYGESPAGRLSIDDAGMPTVVEWLLERSSAPDADEVNFTYRWVDGMAWLQQARFGPYAVSLAYETRPDVVQRAFAGSLRSMAQRLSSLTLNVNLAPPGSDEASRMIREWRLAYAQDARSGLSLLQSVSMRGAPDAAGVVAAWPDLKLHIEKAEAPVIIELPFAQSPPSPANARVGVLSWFGNGRPSLYQVRDDELLVWSDELALAAMPLVAQGVPAELAQYSGRTAFSDVGGDGLSDLVLLGDDIAGHFVFQPGKGFGEFQPWDLAEIPAGVVFQRNASLCDVDGDGRNEIVFYDDVAAAWKALIPGGAHGAGRLEELRGEWPGEGLDGKFRQLADLSGDGLADFVEIADGEVRAWMNCGDMKFAAPRELPFDHGELLQPDRQRLGFADLTGDGASDFYAIEPGRVHYWLNQGTQRFVYQGAIELPGLQGIEEVLVCDWLGLSRSGFLWWADDGRVRFASPVGTGLPGALREVDNGLGLAQEFTWSTTARPILLTHVSHESSGDLVAVGGGRRILLLHDVLALEGDAQPEARQEPLQPHPRAHGRAGFRRRHFEGRLHPHEQPRH